MSNLSTLLVDFEMNQVCIDGKSCSEIIQIGAIICDNDYNIVQTYQALIKSTDRLRSVVKNLTGLQEIDFINTEEFYSGIRHFINWVENYRCSAVISWSKNDKKVLFKQCKRNNISLPAVFNNWIDAQKLVSKEFTTTRKQLQLQKVCDMVHIKTDGKYHDALYDATCMRKILKLRLDKHPKYIKNTLEENPSKYIAEIEQHIKKLESKKDKALIKLRQREIRIKQIRGFEQANSDIGDIDREKRYIENLHKQIAQCKSKIAELNKIKLFNRQEDTYGAVR